MGEQDKNELQVEKEGIVFLIKMEHSCKPSGHKIQNLVEQTDLFSFLKENKVPENFCRKDRDSSIQNKFSCYPCRMVFESVDALRCHLGGKKHANNLLAPLSNHEYVLENGKWKIKKGFKRKQPEDLSKREKGKRNKIQRNIPILPQHTTEKFNETETYLEDGYRRIRPYYFTFVAHAKGRWVGKDLWTVFSKEFRAIEKEAFTRCLAAGLIKVNDKVTTDSYRIENNDFIAHTVHRHELPVTDTRIQIIHEDKDVVVVDKPSSIPVHPCGRYRHNSVIFILAKEHGLKTLNTVHRLDRLTSGVLIFTKNAAKSREMEMAISGRNVRKEYVCRVNGEFPEGEIVSTQPLLVVSYKIGVVVVDKEGKECKTVFKRLQYKNGQSIVACYPETGRMHQIRVHLQYLGFPISNDPLYNSTIFGPEKGKNGVIGKTQDELIAELIKNHQIENWIKTEEFANSRISGETNGDIDDEEESFEQQPLAVESRTKECCTPISDRVTNGDEVNPASERTTEVTDKAANGGRTRTSSLEVKTADIDIDCKQKQNANGHVDSVCNLEGDSYVDEFCSDCKLEFKDPPKETMLIYLHAMRYSGEGFEYKTQLPSWATL